MVQRILNKCWFLATFPVPLPTFIISFKYNSTLMQVIFFSVYQWGHGNSQRLKKMSLNHTMINIRRSSTQDHLILPHHYISNKMTPFSLCSPCGESRRGTHSQVMLNSCHISILSSSFWSIFSIIWTVR